MRVIRLVYYTACKLQPRPRCCCRSESFTVNGMGATGDKFEQAVSIMARLRAPGGCPWDREQTFDSIKPYTVEETYEVLEAIDERDFRQLCDELGDLLLQVLFYAQMAEEEKHFSIAEVLDGLAEKLIKRHPHVFADVKAETSREVVRNWEAIKAAELAAKGKAADAGSMLDSVSTRLPAVMEAFQMTTKVSRVDFDWPDVASVLEKLDEEVAELKEAVASPAPNHQEIAGEVGDLLFAAVNLARYLSLDPESALKRTNRKFRRRFEFIEQQLRAQNRRPEDCTLEEMEALWQLSKGQGNETPPR